MPSPKEKRGRFSVTSLELKIFLFFLTLLIQLQLSCVELIVDSFFFN